MSVITVRTISGIPVATLPADVALENADDIHDELAAATPNYAEGLVLDFTATRYLDSAGVEMVFKLREQLSNRRQRLAIVATADAPLRRILELTGVDKVVTVTPDIAAAVLAASDPAQGTPSPAS